MKTLNSDNCLILVDLQNDFCPGGALAVPEGDQVIPIANRLQAHFDLVVGTQDWHPRNHISFASNHMGHQPGDIMMISGLEQILWPAHCIQDSSGAALHADLNTSHIATLFHKGIDAKIDSYSAFYDNAHRRSTGLADYLHAKHIRHVYIAGLALDYCVKYSALDARHEGFEVSVIRDACRGVNLTPGDSERACQDMQSAGIRLIQASDILLASQ